VFCTIFLKKVSISNFNIFLYSFIFLLFILFFPKKISAQSKIIDDSTKQVYNAKTSLTFQEYEVLADSIRKTPLDTSLRGFHHYTPTQKTNYQLQDLGSWASATRPIYYNAPDRIGTYLGLNRYEWYAYTPDNFQYFDAKSPFIQLGYAQGTTGDQIVEFLYARPINKNTNVGMRYRRGNSNKQYGAENPRDIWNDHTHLSFFTSYISPEKTYKLFFHFSHLNHNNNEVGGVKLDSTQANNNLYGYRLSDANLGKDARSWLTENNFHLGQYFNLAEDFTFFWVADVRRERNAYADDSLLSISHKRYYAFTNGGNVNQKFAINQEKTQENTFYWWYENKFGLKGKFGKFNYLAYFTNRIYSWTSDMTGQVYANYDTQNNIISTDTLSTRLASGIENFIGGKLFYQFSDKTRLTLSAEHLLGKDYLVSGKLESPIFEAEYKSVLYSPTLAQRQYVSNHFRWSNNFSNVFANEIKGIYKLTNKNQNDFLKLFGQYDIVGNYVYFDEKARPTQTSDIMQMFRIGLDFGYKFKKIRTEGNIIYNQNIQKNLFRSPPIMATLRLYCENCVYSKVLESQFGIEAHYKSDYYADGYLPVAKQFYLQNTTNINQYVIVDIFGNVRIGGFRIFGRMIHLNQAGNAGYQTSPNYVGLRRTFTFGVVWQFFN
jgi:hypothetical protein